MVTIERNEFFSPQAIKSLFRRSLLRVVQQ